MTGMSSRHRRVPASLVPARRHVVRGLLTTAALAALVGAGALPASAAPGDVSRATTVVNVGVSSAINLTGLTPSFALNGLPGTTVAHSNVVEMTVATNNATGYAVTVQAERDTLDPSRAGNPDSIPIAALHVREANTTAYTSVNNTTPVTVHTQATRSAVGGDAIRNDYSVDIPFVNDDTYSVTLDYVATAL